MGSDILQIRAQVCDMISADGAILARILAELQSCDVKEFPEARWLLDRVAHMLSTHIDELTEHLRRLGGAGGTKHASSETLASELMAAAARLLNAGTLARSLRNYYTVLSVGHACALMLETNARARSYSSTAAMATRHREEIATMLAAMRELLPVAIKEEIAQFQVAT
jgi:hypothetical protein